MATGSYDAGTMPTTYDNDVSQSRDDGLIDKEWIKSIPGILKVVQIVTSVIVIICASVWPYFSDKYGGGWVQFVSIASLILTVMLYGAYVFRIMAKVSAANFPIYFSLVSVVCIICSSVWPEFSSKWGGGWVQFVSITATTMISVRYLMYIFRLPAKLSPTLAFYFVELVIYAVFTLFYLISAAVSSAFGGKHNSIGACAFFTWLAFILFGVDIYFSLFKWRSSGEGPNFVRMRIGGGTSSSSGGTSQGGADPYAASAPTSQSTVSSVEKGPPTQY